MNIRDAHGKHVYVNIMELAKYWRENSIDFELIQNHLKTIKEDAENSKKSYIDQKYSECFDLLEDIEFYSDHLLDRISGLKEKDEQIRTMTIKDFKISMKVDTENLPSELKELFNNE